MSLRLASFALLLALCAALRAGPASAQADTAGLLDTARAQIEAIQKKLSPELPDAELVAMRATAVALQPGIERALVELAPQLANVEARLAELGPKPATGDEAPGIAEQRAALDAARSRLDAQIKLARLLEVESEQAVDAVSNLRRSLFQARIGERMASILAGAFWSELHAGVVRDGSRARQLADEFAAAVRATPARVWAALIAGVLVLAGVRVWFGQRLLRLTASRVPAGRLRRSVLALATTLLAVIVPTAAAQALRLGLGWQVPASARLDALLASGVGIVSFGAFVAGLGQALLSARRPSWRLPPIADPVAQRLRHYPLALAIAIVASALLDRTAALVQSNLATAVAINCLSALGLGGVLALGFRRGLQLHREALLQSGADPHATRGWPSLLIALGGLVLAVSLVCLLIGYVALGSLLVKQLVWLFTIAAAVYLLNAVVDDFFMSLVHAPGSGDDQSADRPQRWRDQTAVLLSGLLRLCLLVVALVVIAAPFGQGPAELFERAGRFGNDGLVVGEIAVRPAAVLKAVAVFAIAVFCSRLLQRWLADRLLPTTQLDPGMQSSATTLLGYVGMVFAAALALSAVGLGLERVAWVASALSVGIGFGLQAVVSNFVSGLILLAERPVRVGDWVSLGGVEGDIRRINVRATEIQMGDRSTVIVPNSEFITKVVRNVTHANPQGLVQIKLPMPLDTDVQRVRELMLAAFDAHEDVLAAPAPSVFLDGIDANHLVFNANGTVSSPRKAYGVRSELLFDILARLQGAGLPMAPSPTLLLRDAPLPAA